MERVQAEPCSPRCEFFKCGKRALIFRARMPWCSFVNEPCNVEICAFIGCVRGKLIEGNRCALTIKKIKISGVSLRDLELNLKLKGRDVKKLGDPKDVV